MEQAKSDVDAILSDINADAMDCAERLVIGGTMVKVLEHRLAPNENSVADRLVSLARTVDSAEGFAMGTSSYMARAIRQQKIAEIAQESNVNPGKVDPKDIVIKRHPKALAAEALASTSRLGQFGNFDAVGATQALQHAERVLVKLRLPGAKFHRRLLRIPNAGLVFMICGMKGSSCYCPAPLQEPGVAEGRALRKA